MLFLLISSLPLLLIFSKSPTLKPFLSWLSDMCLLLQFLWRVFLSLLTCWSKRFSLVRKQGPENSTNMQGKKNKLAASKEQSEEVTGQVSVLDLPELALDIILGKLSPAGLSNMSRVCKSLRETCRSDHMWEKHMSRKWSKLIGEAARNQWKVYTAPRNESPASTGKSRARGLMRSISCVWPLCWMMKSKALAGRAGGSKSVNCFPDNSIVSWFQALESGTFWFPAQVYNREHGHVGFMMSCYDAEVSYDCRTDTFRARYPPHGRRTVVIEDGVQWERIRQPPVSTSAHELHVSDCLNDLKPGDHIEIQWRRNKEFPYGWWYGVVGHLQSCDGSGFRCCCQSSDTLILEFNQYTPGSRWRRSTIDRKNHREEGNETDGFYGGIRKVSDADEIAVWKKLWPSEVLE